MNEERFLQDYLNQEGGKYQVVSYKTRKSKVIVKYKHPDHVATADISIDLFDLMCFVYYQEK